MAWPLPKFCFLLSDPSGFISCLTQSSLQFFQQVVHVRCPCLGYDLMFHVSMSRTILYPSDSVWYPFYLPVAHDSIFVLWGFSSGFKENRLFVFIIGLPLCVLCVNWLFLRLSPREFRTDQKFSKHVACQGQLFATLALLWLKSLYMPCLLYINFW